MSSIHRSQRCHLKTQYFNFKSEKSCCLRKTIRKKKEIRYPFGNLQLLKNLKLKKLYFLAMM